MNNKFGSCEEKVNWTQSHIPAGAGPLPLAEVGMYGLNTGYYGLGKGVTRTAST